MKSSYEEFFDYGNESMADILASLGAVTVGSIIIMGVGWAFNKFGNKPKNINSNNKEEMAIYYKNAVELSEDELSDYYDKVTDICNKVNEYCKSHRFAVGYPCITFVMFCNQYDFKVHVTPNIRKNTFRDIFKYTLTKGKPNHSNYVFTGPVMMFPINTCTGITGDWNNLVDLIDDIKIGVFQVKDTGQYGLKISVRNEKDLMLLDDGKTFKMLGRVGKIIGKIFYDFGELDKMSEDDIQSAILVIKEELLQLFIQELDMYVASVQAELHKALGINIPTKYGFPEGSSANYTDTYIPIKVKK